MQTFVAREGEKNRLVVLTYTPPATPLQPVGVPDVTTKKSPSLVAPIVVGAVGGAVLALGIGVLVYAGEEAEERDDLRGREQEAISRGDSSEAARYARLAESVDEGVNNNRTIGATLTAAGPVAVATAVVIYLVNRRSSQPRPAIQPIAGPSFAGAVVGTTF